MKIWLQEAALSLAGPACAQRGLVRQPVSSGQKEIPTCAASESIVQKGAGFAGAMLLQRRSWHLQQNDCQWSGQPPPSQGQGESLVHRVNAKGAVPLAAQCARHQHCALLKSTTASSTLCETRRRGSPARARCRIARVLSTEPPAPQPAGRSCRLKQTP